MAAKKKKKASKGASVKTSAKAKSPASAKKAKSAKPEKKTAKKAVKPAAKKAKVKAAPKTKPAPKAKAIKPKVKKVAKKAAPKAAAKKVIKASPKKEPVKKVAKKAPTPEPKKKRSTAADENVAAKSEIAAQAAEAPVTDEELSGEATEEVVLTDADGRRYCRVKDCDQIAVVEAYCRYHYLLFWKRIQIRKKILSEGKLERYIEELTARYPDKFLDMLRKDLRSEKEFLAAIQELEIDESAVDGEFEDETQSYIDEVRGMGESNNSRDDDEY
jgi:hypothetical protein